MTRFLASLGRRVVWAGLILACPACGKRGDPLPPLRRSPAAVEEVRVWQRGPFIHLEWNAPSRNTDGSTEVELEEALILRRVVEIPPPPSETGVSESSGGEEPETEEEVETLPQARAGERGRARPEAETAPEPVGIEAEETQTAEGSEAQEAEGEGQEQPTSVAPPFPSGAEEIATLEWDQVGGLLTFRDPWDPSWEGKRLEYAVRHINRKGRRSELSPVVPIEPLPPLEPPKDLAAEVEAHWVRLRWSPIVANTSGIDKEDAREFGFNVYRREEAEIFPASPLNAAPILGASYEDRDIVFGKLWCYAVRRVAVSYPQGKEEAIRPAVATIESVDSEEVCLTPIDTFAPPSPKDVVAVTSPDGVLLSWGTVEAPDLRGYLVYRARESDGPFQLLTEEPMALASFTDSGVESGEVYFYGVSAVDRVEPWNESPRSPPVSIQVP